MKRIFGVSILLITSFISFESWSQESFPVNGPRHTSHHYIVFTHANIVKSPGDILKDATLIIRDERIQSVGIGLEIPENAVVYDLNGKWIYPAFIELDSDYGLKTAQSSKPATGYRGPQYESKKEGAYNWNQAIHPEVLAVQEFQADVKAAEELRKMGFGAALSHQHDGIIRGAGVLVHTGNEKDNLMVLKEKTAMFYSFSKGSSQQNYPSSQMGSIALIRQSLYDASWYTSAREKTEFNISLQALADMNDLPVIFESEDHLSSLRAGKIAEEFQKTFIIRGSGDEYRRVKEIKAMNSPFILPLEFPLPYNVSNSFDAVDLSLSKMKHWELAPFNARILKDNGVGFAFTSKGLKDDKFWSNLLSLKSTGLTEEDILLSLTTTPAAFCGIGSELGKVENNYLANFIILSDRLFGTEPVLLENWVNGNRYVVRDNVVDIRGLYNLNINKNGELKLHVRGSIHQPKATITKGGKDVPVQLKLAGFEISMSYTLEEEGKKSFYLLSGSVNDKDSRIWVGKAQLPGGNWVDWAAIKQGSGIPEDTVTKDTVENKIPVVNYPLGAYGFEVLPEKEIILFKHATVWTNEEEGILENADVCISDGKILAIGQGLSRVGLFGKTEVDLKIIDATGKHLTTGIIDEHSHIAISRGVNEGAQAISSEVRIGDVIDCDDINIYRQLSGGVTAAQLLHGSANPIGGQSALIKLRWGCAPEEMKIEGADGFIKFALGENVKQSNWGDLMKVRYPQTRMGVEQVFYDGFYRAKEYGEVYTIYESGLSNPKAKKNPPIPPRRDLELETLLEILNKKRFITCHSYVQSEINMLMHVADSMNFTVNTFTHILEGYKVADKMKKHGVGASTFSDWWAYKYEVNDAIPYNAALLTENGVVTAINSDDAEMGRRLNQEAAKTVKYGGLSQEEAWKTVTLNPAKLLHLDQRLGSIKAGKDADIVLWTDNPLKLNARVLKTYVDGRCLFDREKENEIKENMAGEKSRLLQSMIESSGKSGKSQKVKKDKMLLYHCETLEQEYHDEY